MFDSQQDAMFHLEIFRRLWSIKVFILKRASIIFKLAFTRWLLHKLLAMIPFCKPSIRDHEVSLRVSTFHFTFEIIVLLSVSYLRFTVIQDLCQAVLKSRNFVIRSGWISHEAHILCSPHP